MFILDSEAYISLEKWLSDWRQQRDVSMLSPHHQTSGVEAFNALLLFFCPKYIRFSFHGMVSRLVKHLSAGQHTQDCSSNWTMCTFAINNKCITVSST